MIFSKSLSILSLALIGTASPVIAGYIGNALVSVGGNRAQVAYDELRHKKEQMKLTAREKKNKVYASARRKTAKLKTVAGIDILVDVINGKEVEAPESLLMRLDNMTAAEIMLKMVQNMQADMTFQLDRRQAKYDQSKALLESYINDIENKINEFRATMLKKIEDNKAIYEKQIQGRQDIVNEAKKTLEQNNQSLLNAMSTADALMGNETLGAIRGLIVKTTAAKKGLAQKDIINLNKDMEKIQTKLTAESEKLKKVLSDPKFVSQMANYKAIMNKLIERIGNIEQEYVAFRESDFFNYFDTQQGKYDTNITEFTKAASCLVDIKTYDIKSIKDAYAKLATCKDRVINGFEDKNKVPYLRSDTKFMSLPSCKSLTKESDSHEVGQCMTDYTGVPLTSFGDVVVKQ